MNIPRQCKVCGGPIRTDNKVGICKRKPECITAHHRRKVSLWRKKNPVKSNEQKCRYRQRHRGSGRGSGSASSRSVYLCISPGQRIFKIGVSVNIPERIRTLRCACPDIELVTTFPYGIELERWLHGRFDGSRIKGTEWFSGITEVDIKNAVEEFVKLEVISNV